MFLPISTSCYKILRIIYSNLEIKVSKLIKLARVSQKVGYDHLDRLINMEIIKEIKANGLRSLYPNMTSRAGRHLFSLMELEFEYELLNMYPELKDSLSLLRDNAENLCVDCALIFGEAVKKKTKNPKMELLVITNSASHDRIIQYLNKCFSNLGINVTARLITTQGFIELKTNKTAIFKELFKNHVCILNPQLLLELSS